MNDLAKALEAIVAMQRSCAAVKLSIGGVRGGVVVHDMITIHDAPPVAVSTLAARGFTMSTTSNGLELSGTWPN